MPTFTTVDAAWTPSPTTFDDAEARRFDTAMFLGDGTANGVRGGVVRHGDTSLAVTVNGSDQVTVQPGAFVIPAATGLGVYRGALSAAVGPAAGTALAARNATNPRIDLVVIQATSTGAVVKTIDGTPSSSPSAPALPAQHIEVARLTVPQVGGGAVTVDSTFRAYATSIGGDLYVETAARLPGSGNQKTQRAVALDTGIEYWWNGAAWLPSYGAYTPTISGVFATGSMVYERTPKRVAVWFDIAVTGTSSGQIFISLPFAALSTSGFGPMDVVGTASIADTGTQFYVGLTVALAGTASISIHTSTGAVAGAGVPHVWANTDRISGSFSYRPAS